MPRESVVFCLLFWCSNIVVFSERIFRNSVVGHECFFFKCCAMELVSERCIVQHLKKQSCPTAELRKILTENTTILEHQNNMQKLQIVEALHIRNIQRCPWCNCYRRRKWTRRHEFKSWTWLNAFHIALIPLGKVWIQLFSLQLWVNSRTD